MGDLDPILDCKVGTLRIDKPDIGMVLECFLDGGYGAWGKEIIVINFQKNISRAVFAGLPFKASYVFPGTFVNLDPSIHELRDDRSVIGKDNPFVEHLILDGQP